MDAERLCIYCMKEKKHAGGVCGHCQKDESQYETKPHHLPPWTILHGQYLLGTVLGEGGFGITYIAYDLKNKRRVAIKELFISGKVSRYQTRTILMDESARGRQFYLECKKNFMQEAGVLNELQDRQGVVSIYDFFEENDTAYIVMEYLDGVSLNELLKEYGGRISYQDAFQLLRPVMKSLITINARGIFHRDISPDNIRYLTNTQVKLMDFGSSKQVMDDHMGIITVKHGFSAPEQYENKNIGPWVDVYSICATFYKCITGKNPKNAKARTGDEDLESPESMGVEIPDTLKYVLYKGMALDYRNRYQDMWSLYMNLKGACGIGDSSGTDTGIWKDKIVKLFQRAFAYVRDNKWVAVLIPVWLFLLIIIFYFGLKLF